jgi:hypothetical protein
MEKPLVREKDEVSENEDFRDLHRSLSKDSEIWKATMGRAYSWDGETRNAYCVQRIPYFRVYKPHFF